MPDHYHTFGVYRGHKMSKGLNNVTHSGHRERMREKFRKNGFGGMPEHEILEMLLFFALPRVNTNDIAHALIDRFGSLAGVLEASEDELTKVKGVSHNSAVLIRMILPLSHEYHKSAQQAKRLQEPSECGRFLVEYYSGVMKETVVALYLDNSCRVLAVDEICDGDVSSVMMNCRRLMETAFKYPMATAVIIAHNHPGGIALPSKSDIDATQELIRTMSAMGINIIDHIIVTNDDYTSMASSAAFRTMFGLR